MTCEEIVALEPSEAGREVLEVGRDNGGGGSRGNGRNPTAMTTASYRAQDVPSTPTLTLTLQSRFHLSPCSTNTRCIIAHTLTAHVILIHLRTHTAYTVAYTRVATPSLTVTTPLSQPAHFLEQSAQARHDRLEGRPLAWGVAHARLV